MFVVGKSPGRGWGALPGVRVLRKREALTQLKLTLAGQLRFELEPRSRGCTRSARAAGLLNLETRLVRGS